MNSIVESFGPTAATMGGGFFVGIIIGYALKKVIKLLAIIVGLFLAGLAYLQSQQIANIIILSCFNISSISSDS
jgi:uncharacterized membrane protein (Fun14 family)